MLTLSRVMLQPCVWSPLSTWREAAVFVNLINLPLGGQIDAVLEVGAVLCKPNGARPVHLIIMMIKWIRSRRSTRCWKWGRCSRQTRASRSGGHTLHPTPSTLHPQSYTLNPEP